MKYAGFLISVTGGALLVAGQGGGRPPPPTPVLAFKCFGSVPEARSNPLAVSSNFLSAGVPHHEKKIYRNLTFISWIYFLGQAGGCAMEKHYPNSAVQLARSGKGAGRALPSRQCLSNPPLAACTEAVSKTPALPAAQRRCLPLCQPS